MRDRCWSWQGAGTGKTRVLVHRIARLVSRGVAPWKILAVTFSNKAAGEMRERLREAMGLAAEKMWIGTFHGTCARMLGAIQNFKTKDQQPARPQRSSGTRVKCEGSFLARRTQGGGGISSVRTALLAHLLHVGLVLFAARIVVVVVVVVGQQRRAGQTEERRRRRLTRILLVARLIKRRRRKAISSHVPKAKQQQQQEEERADQRNALLQQHPNVPAILRACPFFHEYMSVLVCFLSLVDHPSLVRKKEQQS